MTEKTQQSDVIEQAVAEGGSYEIIRQRLIEQGQNFEKLISEINAARLTEFGTTEMKVLSRMRLRTENNCQAKDLVIVGDYVLFGYNVYIGLKKETRIEDVLSLYQVKQTNNEAEHEIDYELKSVSVDDSFLADSRFQSDFNELYAYYKDTELAQLVLKEGKLLASFQIGDKLTDIRVFRWQVSDDGKSIEYIDNRGERDIVLPASQDFEWTACLRDDVIDGRNPHINILDTLFVDSQRGDITIKVENNTDIGLGIYSEPVIEKNQSLDDTDFFYADLGRLILLKIKPYQEDKFRYLVFNRNNQAIQRIDAIGDACIQLPEEHGIIFPGGYYLTTGECKTFDDSLEGLVYKKTMRSPNGEDVLYVFYEPSSNVIALYPYNLINKSLQNPLFGHGYGFYEDGRMIIFYADNEPNRVHPIQMWQTPYFSEVYASSQPVSQSFYGKIGNAELVRGISELYAISKSVMSDEVSAFHFNELSKQCRKIFDTYFWLDSKEFSSAAKLIKQIEKTAESVIDEYEKVENIRQQSSKALAESEAIQQEIIRHIEPESWHSPQNFVDGLNRIRQHRGHLMTIKEYRYIDVDRINELEHEINKIEQKLNQQTISFLRSKGALDSYYKELEEVAVNRLKCKTNSELSPYLESLQNLATGLDLISEMMTSLKVEDASLQTKIVSDISELYGKLNQQKAELEHQRKSLGSVEAAAQFSARIKLLNQSIHNALGLSITPDKCDEQLARLLVQLEELEGEFAEFETFVADIITKRDEIFESFEEHKQSLQDAQQRKAQSLVDAGNRILQSVTRRVRRISEQDELNAFFAADGLVSKIRDIIGQLTKLNDSVKAEDIDSQFKAIKEQAIRSLRDKSDLYEADGNVIKLGPRHKFTVNKQELDLTILPKDDELFVRLTGTDYFEPLESEELARLKTYWSMSVPSESIDLYRSEYLAYLILKSAESNESALSWSELATASTDINKLKAVVREFATPRYRDGYEKGIHDHDAALILQKLITSYEISGVFKFSPCARGLTCVYWANCQQGDKQQLWHQRARVAKHMAEVFNDDKAKKLLALEIENELKEFVEINRLVNDPVILARASEYLVEELTQENISFSTTKNARRLSEEFKTHLETKNVWRDYQKSLDDIKGQIGLRWAITESWLIAFVQSRQENAIYQSFIGEAIGILNAEHRISRIDREVDIQFDIEGLLGVHNKIKNRTINIQLDEFLDANRYHIESVIPEFESYLRIRQQIITEKKIELRLNEFKPKPLSSFVRNKLINEVYLPLIGDNLAKQIGTVGDKKRTDLMGLLLMISPPGYGKTTLMEYVAERLGLIFMKINCPVIGHSVTSVDPEQADNSAARQELEKLNLALEMGNNVMLYLDDIQHTNSEFLQKFISLCDGTRRIEGVWKKRTKTYDMRGKKFCVIMAGNPYTESGEAFKIPDMLANRADIYNLGDVLGGKEEVFSLSYLENSLTSNPVLAPLATRNMHDIYKFIDMAKGINVAITELSHNYSNSEVKEIVSVLKKMRLIQDVVWRVNRQYIAASSQDDKSRIEPTFKLQGSYRNMNKMAEKISSIMTDEELERLIDDHYLGESQLLTSGTEANLLKLAEIRECMTDKQLERWQKIKSDYIRAKAIGGDDADIGSKVVVQLNDLVLGINSLRESVEGNQKVLKKDSDKHLSIEKLLKEIVVALENISSSYKNNHLNKDALSNEAAFNLSLNEVFKTTLQPLLKIMSGKLDLDLGTHQKMQEINEKLELISEKSGLVRRRKGSHEDKEIDVKSVNPKKGKK